MSNMNKLEIREFVYNSFMKSLFRLSEIQLVGATTMMLFNPSKIVGKNKLVRAYFKPHCLIRQHGGKW